MSKEGWNIISSSQMIVGMRSKYGFKKIGDVPLEFSKIAPYFLAQLVNSNLILRRAFRQKKIK